MPKVLSLLSISFLLLSSQFAYSAEIAGVKFESSAEVDSSELELNGLGVRKATFLKIKVYAAALYLVEKNSDAEAIVSSDSVKRLVLHFVRDVDAEKVKGGWNTGFESNTSDLTAINGKITEFNSHMTDVKSGQEMIFDFLPGKVVASVSGNSFEIEGDDFSKALLRIWLGKNPPNAELKSGLLGK